MIDESFQIIRAVNVALAAATAFALAVRINDEWYRLPAGWRITVAGLLLFPVTAAYGSAEALLMDVPVGARSFMVTLACTTTLIGLWASRTQSRAQLRIITAPDVIALIDGADDAENGEPCTHPGGHPAR